MSDSPTPSDDISGPVLVSIANAARAFDAPARYPLLFNLPNVFNQDFTINTGVITKGSSFITMIEHLIGVLILFPLLLFLRGKGRLIDILKSFDKRDWISITFVSVGGSALGLFFFLISFGFGNPTIAILLQKSQPLITITK